MAFESILAGETGRQMEPGHDLERFRDEEILDALEELISSAQKSVHLTLPAWKTGGPSQRFMAALEGARQKGVNVRMIVDANASGPDFDEEVRPRLESAGCEVRTGDVLRASAVVDGQRALTGHFRIQTERVRETSLRTEGPVVRFIQQAFLDDWKKAGGALPPLADLPWPAARGDQQAAWVNGDGMRLLEFLFFEARHSALIGAPHLPPKEGPGMEALVAGASSGTDVRMVLGSPLSRVPRSLLERGGRVWEYGRAPLTVRVVVIDRSLSFVGSPLAGMVLVHGEQLAEKLARDFEEDEAAAHEITLGSLPRPVRERRKPLIRRMGSWVARTVARRRTA